MRYTVILQGFKELIVTEEQKKVIESHWRAKDGYTIAVGGNTIDTKTVKGIFELPEANFTGVDTHFKDIQREFSYQLEVSSRWTPEQKAIRDMKIRIVPGWKLSGGKREDREMMQIYAAILQFFRDNPLYPYAPSSVWWPLIAEQIQAKSWGSMFFRYVFLHDKEVIAWVERQPKAPPVTPLLTQTHI